MKITMDSVSNSGPAILAMFQNAEHTVTIKVLDDISYEITRNGYTSKVMMEKWYLSGQRVITHIENDIQAGYYPGVRRVA